MNESEVPTPAAMWDFIVGLKETTESGFLRMESLISGLQSNMGAMEDRLQKRIETVEHRLGYRIDGVDQRLDGVEHRLNGLDRRLVRIDDRLSGLESKSAPPS